MSRFLIGGFDVTVYWSDEDKIPLLAKELKDFSLLKDTGRKEKPISISILENDPGPNTGELIFSYDKAWALYTDKAGFIIKWFDDKNRDKILWTVKSSHNFEESFIYCNYDNDTSSLITSVVLHHTLRFLMQLILVDNLGMLVHSAGGTFQGKGVVFPAVSGGGKSTFARLLSSSPESRFFTDDRSIIRKIDGKWLAYGTPWPGEEEIARNDKAPLAALVFLSHGDRNEIIPIDSQQALQRLIQVSSIHWFDAKRVNKSMDFLEQIIEEVPLYELRFLPNSIASMSFDKFIDSL